MSHTESTTVHQPGEPRRGPLAWWHRTPLYLRIVGALILGTLVGLVLQALAGPGTVARAADTLKEIGGLVLQLLRALATPLILIAVVHALARAQLQGRTGLRLVGFLLVNTLVAIGIGLLVANVVQPGRWGGRIAGAEEGIHKPLDAWKVLTGTIPESLVAPLVKNDVMQVILIALAFGLALRVVRRQQQREGNHDYQVVEKLIHTAFGCMMVVLHWIIDIIPVAVFCVVAASVAKEGFAPFQSLGAFMLAVILALFLQACYYMTRVRFGSWVRPWALLRGGADALFTAFSTASSTATMPVTYACLKDRVGLREQSASLGSLVGSNFNNDGTALYEAMAALFISQTLGRELGLTEQLLVVLTSVVASVGAAGIPEAGLVTMTLVFSAVHLPTEYILTLVAVDWFLDRCRTAINVMGDMTVSCLLDGRHRALPEDDGQELAPLPAT